MERKIISWVVVVGVLAALVFTGLSCSSPQGDTLTVFAAAGVKPPLDEICQKYGRQHNNYVDINYGGGGEVLNQMMLSRSGDIYIAPEQSFMETAREKQAIDPQTIRSVAYMIPVIAVPEGNPGNISTLDDLARPGIQVAVTRAETTLLGKYAPEIFDKAGLGEKIGKNIVTEAARPDNILTMLIMGQADAGIIWHFYGSQAPDEIDIIFLPPEELTGIGEIQAAVSTYCENEQEALKFIDFITSAEGKEVFKDLGYIVDVKEVEQYRH